MNLLNFYEFVRNIVADFIEITNKLCTTLPCLSKLLATSAHADGKKGLISYEPIRDFKVLQRLKSSQFLSEYPPSGCQRQNKSFCENWNGKILLTDSSLLAKSLHSAGENNRAASKGAFIYYVIKKVGGSGLKMITNCYMVDGCVALDDDVI